MASSEVRVSTTEISREILDIVNIKDVTQEYRSAYIINGRLADTGNAAYIIFMSNNYPLMIANDTDVEIANVVGERHDFTNLEIITVITIDLLINGILIDGYCSYTDGDVITLSVSLDTHILT